VKRVHDWGKQRLETMSDERAAYGPSMRVHDGKLADFSLCRTLVGLSLTPMELAVGELSAQVTDSSAPNHVITQFADGKSSSVISCHPEFCQRIC
jgi:hypothetical protein